MTQPSRSILKMIFTNFLNSLKPRSIRGEIIGKDYFGNTYYEIKSSQTQRKQRWFEPIEGDKFNQELPAEWESWLRYRRLVPPTDAEVTANAELAKLKKINAAALESKRKPMLENEYKPEPSGYESFPVYKEYEVHPGDHERKSESK